MRRGFGIALVLAVCAWAGCRNVDDHAHESGGSDAGGTAGTGASGTSGSASTGSGTAGSGTAGGTTGAIDDGGGSLESFDCPSVAGNFLYLHGDGGVDPGTGRETGNYIENGVLTLAGPSVTFANDGLHAAPAFGAFYTVELEFAAGANEFELATDSSATGEPLQRDAFYAGATRYPFDTAGPGFDIAGDGRACTQETADFELSHIEQMVDGGLWYAGKFKQLCENGGVALFGCFNYQGPAPGLPKDAGAPDAGRPCADLTGATLALANATSPVFAVTNTDVTLQFLARNAQGAAIVGCPVNFTEPNATDVPMIIIPASVNTDSNSVASTKVRASLAGMATLLADMSGVQSTVAFEFVAPADAGNPQDAGAQDPTMIAWTSTSPTSPSVLGIAGFGINEQGSMTFEVADQDSRPIPGVTVTFDEAPYGSFADGGAAYYAPLTNTTAVTDGNGKAIVAFHSGPQVGTAEITASALNLQGNAISTSQTIPVRGAKPSASGFRFFCAHEALPVYTTTTSTESMTCTVLLADRFSNRVGIPTAVTFYTEAGTIEANATTAAFDPMNPSTEGSATVTFTASASGTAPADVDPLPGEPSTVVSVAGQNRTLNPRDRLVTLIAITTGEEQFVDANNNGQYDPGEIFYDMPDPFIDANDDNQYGEVYAGGPVEERFCSTQNQTGCGPGFSYGNGQWDSNATIWTTTHVMFTGVAVLTNTDASGNTPGSTPACIAAGTQGTTPVFAYDDHFNLPSQGTTFSATLVGTPQGLSSTSSLSSPLAETPGLFGSVYVTVPPRVVSAVDGGACVVSNGAACRAVPLVTGFDDDEVGMLYLNNTNMPTDGGAQCVAFTVQGIATNAHSITTSNAFTAGTFEP